jgi:hypothetical protein
MTAPLDGLLVVELSRALAGLRATMMLADLGARVIKIEALPVEEDTGAGDLVVPGILGSRLDSTGKTSQRRGQIRFNDYVITPRTNASDRVQSGLCAGVPADLRTEDGHVYLAKSPEHGNKQSH